MGLKARRPSNSTLRGKSARPLKPRSREEVVPGGGSGLSLLDARLSNQWETEGLKGGPGRKGILLERKAVFIKRSRSRGIAVEDI